MSRVWQSGRGVTAAWVVCLLLSAGLAQADQTVSPVLVELSPQRRIATVTLSNGEGRPLRFQVQTVRWQQIEGQDQYEETNDLLVVPAIVLIAPDSKQIFRVTSRRAFGSQELAYRLIFQDITPLDDSSKSTEVRFNVDHNLPLFVRAIPTEKGKRGENKGVVRLAPCPIEKAAAGCIRVENAGSSYLTVTKITLAAGDWNKDILTSGRILVGAWRQWYFERPATAQGPLTIRVETAAGSVNTESPAASQK